MNFIIVAYVAMTELILTKINVLVAMTFIKYDKAVVKARHNRG